MNPEEVLKEIASQVAVCEKCVLHNSRKKAVPGEGPANAKVMFIGEGPGFYENEQGRPFVGPAGQFLEELLEYAGLKRSEVFIGNVVKCRPPANRDPLPDELGACRPYLERQIEAINPKVIVTLGRYSMAHFLPNAKISSIHGRPSWVNGRLVIPMYHPAAALHQPALKNTVVTDFKNLPRLMAASRPPQGDVNPPVQPEISSRGTSHPDAFRAPAQPALTFQPEEETVPEVSPQDEKARGDSEDKDKPVQLTLF